MNIDEDREKPRKETAAEETRRDKRDLAAIKRYSVEIQGKRITVKYIKGKQKKRAKRKRSAIYEFSRKARGRMLRKIASINWAAAGQGMLITVTYPDECSDHTMEERRTHRFLLDRFVSDRVGRKLACIWRVEWMPRQSGMYIGQLRPHMHLLYLGQWSIALRGIRERWMEIIRTKTYTQIDVSYITVGDMCSMYVAKYCSKEASSSFLDNVPYLNRTGRHTGQLRGKLIPMHPRFTYERISQAILKMLKREACRTLWWFDPRFEEGFTILGDLSLPVIQEFRRLWLDATGEIA